METHFSLSKGFLRLLLFNLLILATSSCKKDEARHDYVPSAEIVNQLTRLGFKLVRWQERKTKDGPYTDIVIPNCIKDDVMYFFNGGVFEYHDKAIKCSVSDPDIQRSRWEYTRENELLFNNFGHIVITLDNSKFVVTKDAERHEILTYIRTF